MSSAGFHTHQERAACANDGADGTGTYEEKNEDGAVVVSVKVTYRQRDAELPLDRDDRNRWKGQRSWKKHRKTRWR